MSTDPAAPPAPAPAPTPPPAPAPPAPAPAPTPPTPAPPPPPAPDPSATYTPPTEDEWKAHQAELDRAKSAAASASAAARRKEQEGMSAEERAADNEKRANNLEGGVKTARVKAEAATIAQRLGFKSPTLAERAIDLAGIDAELDPSTFEAKLGPTALAELERRLTAALQTYPELGGVAPPTTLAGAGAPATPGGQPVDGAAAADQAMNGIIRRATGRQ